VSFWGSCLSINDSRDRRGETQGYGVTDFALRNPGAYPGNFHFARDFTVRRNFNGPLLAQDYVAPIDCVLLEVNDQTYGYGYHVWMGMGDYRVLFAHGIPDSVTSLRSGERARRGQPIMAVGTSGFSKIQHAHIGLQQWTNGRWAWIDPGPYMYGERKMPTTAEELTEQLEDQRQRYKDLDDLHLQDLGYGARLARVAVKLAFRYLPKDPKGQPILPDDLAKDYSEGQENFKGRG